jgi:hypothetical protein
MRSQSSHVHAAFGIVIFVVVGLALVIGLITLLGRGRIYDQIGRGGLSLRDERDAPPPGPAPGSVAGVAERDEEIRQMLEAQNARRTRRGQPALDIDDELARLTRPTVDAGLREEIRQLVLARNARRERQGKPPLDVEAEIERQIANLT